MTGTLYLVGTPIGNLGDVTERARQTLADADLVAAEDTRRTGRLLKALGISARLVSLYEANEAGRVPDLVRALLGGANVAVVSDAGMPSVSDPGYRLVTGCIEAGVEVDVVPGPSAAVAALVVSGLPTDRFAFEGFLPRSGRARHARLEEVAVERRTVVLFESSRRVKETMRDLEERCGDRRVAVVRELTKMHQEVLRGRLGEVIERVGARELRGEVVLVLEGSRDRGSPTLVGNASGARASDAVEIAAGLLARGARKREAAREASRATGIPAGRIYDGLVEAARRQGAAGSSTGASERRAETSE